MEVLSAITTFLFTDIEGSSRLWEQEPVRMRSALAGHDALAREAVETHRGVVVKMSGDGMHAAFDDPLDAVGAVLKLQQMLANPAATAGVALRVRCGVHAGPAERRDNDFFGSAVNRAARIANAAHGGQVLLSQAVAALLSNRLPAGVTLRDLGAVRLRDLASPERVYQVLHPMLRESFPALRTLEATPNNLSQQLTSFVGRERELDEVRALLRTTRLLTLTGAGGIGKTRLSQQLAADMMDDFPDGVWFVELASLTDPRLVAAFSGFRARGQGGSRAAGRRSAAEIRRRTGGSCSSSTTASTWCRPAPSWPRNCCKRARRSRSWHPAASTCTSRGRRPIRFPRSPSRPWERR